MAHSHRCTRNGYQPGGDYLQRHLSPAPKKRRCTGVVHYHKARHAPGVGEMQWDPGNVWTYVIDVSRIRVQEFKGWRQGTMLVKPLSKPIMRGVHSRWANRFMIPLHAGSQLGSNSENGKAKVAIPFNTARDRTGQCSDFEDFLFQFSREYRILVGGFNRHWEVFVERQIWAHFFLMLTDSAQWWQWWMTAMDDESRKNSKLACRRSLIDRIQQTPGRRSERFGELGGFATITMIFWPRTINGSKPDLSLHVIPGPDVPHPMQYYEYGGNHS
ncbi:hypothetical protein K438DRAFT_1761036 [Mycena galopus ATCC 62051]|nr:hypothetical protein K438DRAFT_1761036 [Mycena galopus ATCC 62051]